MTNDFLEKEHLDAINNPNNWNLGQDADIDEEKLAKSSAVITVKHMKGFAEWILKECDIDADWENDDGDARYLYDGEFKTTEELIELYFESLNA